MDQAPRPRLVTPDAAVVYDHLQGEKINILLSGQETDGALTLFIDEVPPGGGPPLHMHQNEDETFFLLAGELLIQSAEKCFPLLTGSAAFLPRGVPHTFANVGSETARILVALTPGGLEAFFAAVEPLVTQAEPDMAAVLNIAAGYGISALGPPLLANPERPAKTAETGPGGPAQAPIFKLPNGETYHLLLTGEQTGGQLTLMQGELPAGSGTSLHRHEHEDEFFYLLDGHLKLRAGDQEMEAVTHSAVFLPRQVPHQLQNPAEARLRALALLLPAGLENYFEKSFALLQQGTATAAALAALNLEYGLATDLPDKQSITT